MNVSLDEILVYTLRTCPGTLSCEKTTICRSAHCAFHRRAESPLAARFGTTIYRMEDLDLACSFCAGNTVNWSCRGKQRLYCEPKKGEKNSVA